MLYTLKTSSWQDLGLPLEEQQSAIAALEGGGVVYLPQLSFQLSPAEKELLNPRILVSGAKNVSFDSKNKQLKGVASLRKDTTCLTVMMARFASFSRQLAQNLFPHYTSHLLEGRTSFRPIEVLRRKTSLLKDDTRLHVDAFPSMPNQGKRILRVLSNVNPIGSGRVWHIGEPFEKVVEHFLPKLRKPWVGTRYLLSLLNMTKSYRSLYDHYMLMLHNAMKKNDAYQSHVKKTTVDFPAGSTWVVMTDCVSHAALSGQFLLEHTFYLPPHCMLKVEQSPLFILEQALGRKLIDGREC